MKQSKRILTSIAVVGLLFIGYTVWADVILPAAANQTSLPGIYRTGNSTTARAKSEAKSKVKKMHPNNNALYNASLLQAKKQNDEIEKFNDMWFPVANQLEKHLKRVNEDPWQAPFSIIAMISTVIIGLITVYIAWQQHRLDKLKIKKGLYDRKLHVFDEVKKIIPIITNVTTQSRDSSMRELIKFHASVSESVFLFGPEISEYLKEIFERGSVLIGWHGQFRTADQTFWPEDYDPGRVSKGILDETSWLSRQINERIVEAKFQKDLSLRYIALPERLKEVISGIRKLLIRRH